MGFPLICMWVWRAETVCLLPLSYLQFLYRGSICIGRQREITMFSKVWILSFSPLYSWINWCKLHHLENDKGR
jgi:hypothetical protein